jgi:hypothetical protein
MGRSKKVFLPNGRNWSKKGDANKHFKEILDKYDVGDRVVSADDHSDLSALVSVYDAEILSDKLKKSGPGIDYFEKDWDRDHSGQSKCFYVVRTDGTRIDFSIGKALDAAANRTNQE